MARLPFWRDLNVFAAVFATGITFGGFLLHAPMAVLLMLVLPASKAEVAALPAGYAMLAALLAWIWRKRGLSPAEIAPGRERRFRIGHVLLAVGNVGGVLLLVQAALGPWIAAHKVLLPLVKAGFLSAVLAPVALVVGLWFVFSSRAPEAGAQAFAETVPLDPEPAVRRPNPYVQVPVRTTGAHWTAVVVGILVTSFVGVMVATFGALSFQNRVEQYTGVVLPVMGAFFVLYLATSLWLAGRGRGSLAVGVAWAPAVLVVGAAFLFNTVALVAMTLFGR